MLHPRSGRFLEIYSNQPAIQLYTANDFPDTSKVVPEKCVKLFLRLKVKTKSSKFKITGSF